jgi:hypothetical protein
MLAGTRVMVDHAVLSYHEALGVVTDSFLGDLNGHDLGRLVGVRLDDGTEVALPPRWLQPLRRGR